MLFRIAAIGLLGLAVIGPTTRAEDIYAAVGPELGRPIVERLPEVEPIRPEPIPTPHIPPADTPPTPTLVAPVKLWEGGVKLGLDGSEGNSQTFNFHFGFDAKRKAKRSILSLELNYHKNTNDSLETANRLFFDWRYERPFPQTPWSWFVHGSVVYDEFQAWNTRVAVDTGVGYELIKTDTTSLLGRFGSGFSREIGGPDDSYVPELVFGMDFERQLTKRQKLTATVEYFPDVTEFCNYRINSRAGWEVLLDEQMNLSMKLLVNDRYDSTPGGAKPNDLDYSMVLLWKF